jgi:tetratricopeptide (TPR) repeat protein
MSSTVIPNINKHVIPAKAGIYICLTMLLLLSGRNFCLADDPTVAQLKAENLELENKNAALTQAFNDISNDRQAVLENLRKTVDINAELTEQNNQLALTQSKNQSKQILPDACKLREKLEESVLELMKEKKTDGKLEQEVAKMHYNLGVILQGQNRYDEAIKEFEGDLSVNSNDADAHYNLALIYDKGKNNREEAIVHYNIYLKINPDAPDALEVKERLTDLEAQQKIWGNPDATGIDEKQDLGRL